MGLYCTPVVMTGRHVCSLVLTGTVLLVRDIQYIGLPPDRQVPVCVSLYSLVWTGKHLRGLVLTGRDAVGILLGLD